MRIAYFDCIAGISGDMALGSLVDAGADFDALRETLRGLPLEPFSLEREEVESFGVRATKIHVDAPAAGVIRTYSSIRTLLDQATDIPGDALRNAQRIFRRLAEAEATVHRKEVELVTFHEVGGVDSIVDIVGTALAVSMLEIERVFASPVPTGFGMARTEHGALPIPGPAVVELLRGAPMYSRGVPFELVTPTGAAILATLVEGYGDMPGMRVEAVGYGAGEQRLDFPNVTRVLIGQEERAAAVPSGATGDGDVVLETNIDDLNPELYEYVLERLMAAGAQDAWLTPIVMKKSRPAVTVSVLCASADQEAIREVLFRETGTLGVRATAVAKQALGREEIEVATRFGKVGVKVGYLDGQAITVAPEFEDCVRVARAAGIPAKDVYEEAAGLARAQLRSSD